MQAALNEFQQAMNAVDWSKMSFVKDENGNEVMHLPVQSLTFEAKLNAFSDRRRALQRRFPQLVSLDSETRNGIVESCISKSVVVSTKLLDMGINVFQPMTKSLIEPWMESEDYRFLGNWLGYSGSRYVEAIMLVFANGHTATYIDPNNTVTNAYLPTYYLNGNRYFTGYTASPVRTIIHTHTYNMNNTASDDDKAAKLKDVTNIDYYIYQGGALHPF